MGLFPYGAQCCNNCRHWQCHAKRSVRGNPPKEIYTDSNCDKCSRTGRSTLSKDSCSGFSHYDGATIIFPLPPEKEEPGPGEVFYQGMMELIEENRRQAAAASQPRRVVKTCSRCDGFGHVACSSCGGSGVSKCTHCDGEGGFQIKLEMREEFERFRKEHYWVPDSDLDSSFYATDYGWNCDIESTLAKAAQRCDICSKSVSVAYGEDVQRHVKDVLRLTESDFVYPEGTTEDIKCKITTAIDEVCKDVDTQAEKWDTGGWVPEYRIKNAKITIKQAPCIVRVQLCDSMGFEYEALVNLVNRKVHLYEPEPEKVLRRLKEIEASAEGNADLQNDIGQLYANYPKFSKVVTKDYEKAVEWFLRAARAGHADAMDNLGNCYKNGDGVPEDKEVATVWYSKAAKKGLPWGQFHYAKCFLDGMGVEKDRALALHWFLKSARQGLAEAQNMVARCAEEGCGMKEDPDFAFYWYEKAANNGHALAMHNLSNCFGRGYGCESSSSKRDEWKEKAKANGYVEKASSGW